MTKTKAQQEKTERVYVRSKDGAAQTAAFIADLRAPGPHSESCICKGNGWVLEGQGGVVLEFRSFTGRDVYRCPKEPAA